MHDKCPIGMFPDCVGAIMVNSDKYTDKYTMVNTDNTDKYTMVNTDKYTGLHKHFLALPRIALWFTARLYNHFQALPSKNSALTLSKYYCVAT